MSSHYMQSRDMLSEKVEFPTPNETDAVGDEEIRAMANRRCSSARTLNAFIRSPEVVKQTTGKSDQTTNIIDQGARLTFAMSLETIASLFEHLKGARSQGITTHFSERQGTPESPNAGLMLDYDLTINKPDATFSDRDLHRVAAQVVRTLQRDLLFPKQETVLHVFSIVKTAPIRIGTSSFKYGFHILVPGIRVSREYKKYLLKDLRENRPIEGVLRNMGITGAASECLDANSASVPVLFLGSCKRGGIPYNLGPAVSVCFDSATVAEPRVPEYFPVIQCISKSELAKYNLVAELSICFEARYSDRRAPLAPVIVSMIRPELVSEVTVLGQRHDKASPEMLMTENSLSTLAILDPDARYLHQLLDILDKSYHQEYFKWRNVIFALANTSPTFRPLAVWFSQKYSKWVDGTSKRIAGFDQLWDGAVARRNDAGAPITDRSIIRWAKEAGLQRFAQISDRNFFTILVRYVYKHDGVLEHYMVAKVLHAMLGSKFAVDVSDGQRGRYTYCWFEFVVSNQKCRPGEIWKWRKEVDPDEMHLYMSENLVKVFQQVLDHIEEQREAAEGEDKAKYYKHIRGAFQRSYRKIFNDTFKNGVIRQANYLFRRRDFAKQMDQDPLLLGVGNGVLKLGSTCELIDHYHEYQVMTYTPVRYSPFDARTPWTRLLLKAFEDIFPEPDFRNWILFFAASSLAGGLKEGLLLLWYGGGANGKTWFMRMVAKVLGPYGRKLDIGLLTAERSRPGDPNTAIMQMKGARWGYVEETQKGEVLNSQRLKEMVNPGEISANEKYKEQETFENTANLIVGQNFDFRVKTLDHGTWRRLRHYSSKTRFRKNPNPANSFEKKVDQRFILDYVKDPDCLSALQGILAYYYERLQREYGGLLKSVRSQTLEYETERFRNSQDVFNRFVMEMIVNSPGNGHAYLVSEVANQFVEWFGTTIGANAPDVCEARQELENSALRGFLKRMPNATHVLLNCRILTQGTMTLVHGETYMAAQAVKHTSPPTCEKRQKWWARVQDLPDKVEEAAEKDLYDIAFSKVRASSKIEDTSISNADLAAMMDFADPKRTTVSIADVFV